MEARTQNPLHRGRDNDTANAVGQEIELASRGQAALRVSEAEVGGKPHPQFDLTPFPCAHAATMNMSGGMDWSTSCVKNWGQWNFACAPVNRPCSTL